MDQIRKPQPKHVTAPTAIAVQPKRRTGWWVAIIIVILLLICCAAAAYQFIYKVQGSGLVGVKSSQYQALFLTNGQVYFGKLEQADEDTIKISDIYYLQVQQEVQPKEGAEQEGETQLVKLGEELHGPEDEMYIDRSQVLFWENLKQGSKVTSAIDAYKSQ